MGCLAGFHYRQVFLQVKALRAILKQAGVTQEEFLGAR